MDFEDDPYNPSFRPSLPPSELREKVASSGYGSGQVAKQPKRDVERTWEVPAPFVPELPADALREKVPSSGYGKVLITPVKKEPVFEVPEFKPNLPKDELREKVPSSAYGKVIPKIVKKEKEAEGPYRPQLPQCDLRQKAASSQYGKTPVRPKTAPAKPQSTDFTLDCIAYSKTGVYAPPKDRHVLLKEKDIDESELQRGRSASPIRTKSASGEKYRQRAASANYGKVLVPNPVHKPREEVKPVVVTKTALADKVGSSGYGKAAPKQGVKHTPPPPAPLWSPSKKAPPIWDIPDPVKPKAYQHVPASGYGRVSPSKVDRQDKELEPKWTPNSKKVHLGIPEPVRSTRYDYVSSSGYGSTYSPATAYRPHGERYLDEEEVYDEEGEQVDEEEAQNE